MSLFVVVFYEYIFCVAISSTFQIVGFVVFLSLLFSIGTDGPFLIYHCLDLSEEVFIPLNEWSTERRVKDWGESMDLIVAVKGYDERVAMSSDAEMMYDICGESVCCRTGLC